MEALSRAVAEERDRLLAREVRRRLMGVEVRQGERRDLPHALTRDAKRLAPIPAAVDAIH